MHCCKAAALQYLKIHLMHYYECWIHLNWTIREVSQFQSLNSLISLNGARAQRNKGWSINQPISWQLASVMFERAQTLQPNLTNLVGSMEVCQRVDVSMVVGDIWICSAVTKSLWTTKKKQQQIHGFFFWSRDWGKKINTLRMAWCRGGSCILYITQLLLSLCLPCKNTLRKRGLASW